MGGRSRSHGTRVAVPTGNQGPRPDPAAGQPSSGCLGTGRRGDRSATRPQAPGLLATAATVCLLENVNKGAAGRAPSSFQGEQLPAGPGTPRGGRVGARHSPSPGARPHPDPTDRAAGLRLRSPAWAPSPRPQGPSLPPTGRPPSGPRAAQTHLCWCLGEPQPGDVPDSREWSLRSCCGHQRRRQEAAACLPERPSWAHKGRRRGAISGSPAGPPRGLGAGSAALEGAQGAGSLDEPASDCPAPAAAAPGGRLQTCRPSAPSLRGPRAQRSRPPAVGRGRVYTSAQGILSCPAPTCLSPVCPSLSLCSSQSCVRPAARLLAWGLRRPKG